MNPATNQPGHAVMPLTAFPCEIKEGDTFLHFEVDRREIPVIICKEDKVENKIKSNDGE